MFTKHKQYTRKKEKKEGMEGGRDKGKKEGREGGRKENPKYSEDFTRFSSEH